MYSDDAYFKTIKEDLLDVIKSFITKCTTVTKVDSSEALF